MSGLERVREERLAEDVWRGTLRGTRVLLARKPGQVRSSAILGVQFGSCDARFRETPGGEVVAVPDGVAHFLEHKLFEGKTVPVFQRYAELGASCNAATSFRTTHYYFSTTDAFEACVDFLLEFVQHPVLTAERVAKEKGIIEQELRMYLDNPAWRVFFNLLGILYAHHPVRHPPGGTVESIHRISLEDCLRCHRGFYRPENFILAASGDFDPEALAGRIEKGIVAREGSLPERILPEAEGEIATREVAERMAVARPRALLGYRTDRPPGEGEALLREELAGAFALEALFGRSSEIFEDLYRRGVVDDSFSASATVEESFAFTVLGGESEDPARFRAELLAVAERAGRDGIRKPDLERVRRRHLGAAVRRYQSSESTATSHLREAFRGLPPFATVRAVESVTHADVEAWVRERLHPRRAAFSTLSP